MNKTYRKTLIVIAGPTAVGKTRIAIDVAKKLNTSIISADSRQCYKEMNIGTACPSEAELQEVRHYFIRKFSITENISAADYEGIALKYLEDIFNESDFAIVCGGTGLYIKALTEGLDEMPEINKIIDEEVNNNYKNLGLAWLQNCVQEEDFTFYTNGEIQNPARLIRALVFKRSTGKSITEFKTGNKKERNFNIIKIVLNMPRENLYSRINTRVEEMIQQGLIAEVKKLYPLKHLKNLQTVGYSELFDYFDQRCNLETAIEKIKQHSRNYAKRQMTWFKKQADYQVIEADNSCLTNIFQLIKP